MQLRRFARLRVGALRVLALGVDVQHAGDKRLIQGDIPDLKKEGVHVDVRNHALGISDERRNESESYGGISAGRNGAMAGSVEPLPEGAKPETASATFDAGDGKLPSLVLRA